MAELDTVHIQLDLINQSNKLYKMLQDNKPGIESYDAALEDEFKNYLENLIAHKEMQILTDHCKLHFKKYLPGYIEPEVNVSDIINEVESLHNRLTELASTPETEKKPGIQDEIDPLLHEINELAHKRMNEFDELDLKLAAYKNEKIKLLAEHNDLKNKITTQQREILELKSKIDASANLLKEQYKTIATKMSALNSQLSKEEITIDEFTTFQQKVMLTVRNTNNEIQTLSSELATLEESENILEKRNSNLESALETNAKGTNILLNNAKISSKKYPQSKKIFNVL